MLLFIDASKDFVKGKIKIKLSKKILIRLLQLIPIEKTVDKYAYLASFDDIKRMIIT